MSHVSKYSNPLFHHIAINGVNIVFDPVNICPVQVDDFALEALQMFTMLPREVALSKLSNANAPLREAAKEVNALIAMGLFQAETTSPDARELDFSTAPKEVVISLTYRCNLRCRYCYVNNDCEGDRHKPGVDMPEEIVDATYDWAMNDFARDAESLSFWAGSTGEMLLLPELFRYLNTKVEKYTKENPTGKNVTAVVHTTNLTLWESEEAKEFLGFEKYKWRVSIDGPQHIHDAVRVFAGGQGSYDIVATAAKYLLQTNTLHNHSVCATVTGNKPHITEIFCISSVLVLGKLFSDLSARR